MLKITSESIATFLSSMQSHNTKRAYLASLQSFVRGCGDILTQEKLLEFRSHLLSSQLSSSTINNRLSALLSFAKFNSTALFIPLMKRNPTKVHPLSDSEITNLLSNLTADQRLVVEVLLATGLRISEFVWLASQKITADNIPTWLSLDSNSVESVIITGKGSKQRTIFFKQELGSILYHNIINSNTLFGRKWSAITVRRFLVKVNSKLHPHLFRHTFAIKALRKGCTMLSLARMLGHSDISTTQIYVNYSDREMKDAWGNI